MCEFRLWLTTTIKSMKITIKIVNNKKKYQCLFYWNKWKGEFIHTKRNARRKRTMTVCLYISNFLSKLSMHRSISFEFFLYVQNKGLCFQNCQCGTKQNWSTMIRITRFVGSDWMNLKGHSWFNSNGQCGTKQNWCTMIRIRF